jgi:hypothetical protein
MDPTETDLGARIQLSEPTEQLLDATCWHELKSMVVIEAKTEDGP